ncbi:MAG TPA: 5-dehydro-4-deoxyglucarate dehydratase [Rhizomicrobium sp.]|nr:5-dehydro-4-deoxyglucarate dehydratase [Rhizomicrobium sp.]
MPSLSPQELKEIIPSVLLSFPVTDFDASGAFAPAGYRARLEWLMPYGASALFAAGGTGEFFSLTPSEVEIVVSAAVGASAGRVPVVAGCGYGTAIAVELAKSAEQAGADGLLLLPPYLMVPSQEGLIAHIEAVCKATSIGVIVYNRDNAVLTEDSLAKLCDRNPNLVGFKDGVGDIELMMRVYAKLGDRLTYVGGLPTAETFALPYLEMGVTTYSSAIYNFMPEWALAFYDAVRAKNHAKVMKGLKEFVLPYIAIRNENKGYAVSIVKAGMTAIGRGAGPVRAPLTELTPDQLGRLKKLIEAARPV